MSTLMSKTRTMVIIAMMSAVATVIYFFDFNVPLMPGFIKLDLSNIISLITGFSLGPVAGAAVCLIKNLIHLDRGRARVHGCQPAPQLLRDLPHLR